jgi:hypothetical protein
MTSGGAEFVFEWDRNKAEKNIRRHKITFEEAKGITEELIYPSFRLKSENPFRIFRFYTGIQKVYYFLGVP